MVCEKIEISDFLGSLKGFASEKSFGNIYLCQIRDSQIITVLMSEFYWSLQLNLQVVFIGSQRSQIMSKRSPTVLTVPYGVRRVLVRKLRTSSSLWRFRIHTVICLGWPGAQQFEKLVCTVWQDLQDCYQCHMHQRSSLLQVVVVDDTEYNVFTSTKALFLVVLLVSLSLRSIG